MQKLLLWDIDGTLIRSGGAGMRALDRALRSVFEIEGTTEDIDFAGRTDRWIARRIFEKFAIEHHEENVARLFDCYFALLPSELVNPSAFVIPGVRDILALAGQRGFTNGLLTGNLRRGAELKLRHHGLWHHFPFGAFADDSEHRNDLGPHALRRAREHTGATFEADRVWVIGDTPYDIACGRVIGARTMATASGGFTLEELAGHKPDALFADFSDVEAFFRAVS